jgi:hypothetical protein
MYFEGHYEDSFGTQLVYNTTAGEPFERVASTSKKLVFKQVKLTRKTKPSEGTETSQPNS